MPRFNILRGQKFSTGEKIRVILREIVYRNLLPECCECPAFGTSRERHDGDRYAAAANDAAAAAADKPPGPPAPRAPRRPCRAAYAALPSGDELGELANLTEIGSSSAPPASDGTTPLSCCMARSASSRRSNRTNPTPFDRPATTATRRSRLVSCRNTIRSMRPMVLRAGV